MSVWVSVCVGVCGFVWVSVGDVGNTVMGASLRICIVYNAVSQGEFFMLSEGTQLKPSNKH